MERLESERLTEAQRSLETIEGMIIGVRKQLAGLETARKGLLDAIAATGGMARRFHTFKPNEAFRVVLLEQGHAMTADELKAAAKAGGIPTTDARLDYGVRQGLSHGLLKESKNKDLIGLPEWGTDKFTAGQSQSQSQS